MKAVKLIVLLALVLCCLFSLALAQSNFATVTGVVQDPSAAVIPGVSIEATHVERNFVYKAVTNDAGLYTLANLPPGTYTIRVVAAGFQEYKVDEVILTFNQTRRVDATLAVGQSSTVVEVSAGAALIETESARIAETKDREVLRAMPLTLRRAWDYFTMTPSMERSGNWSISLAGSGNNQSNATMDGATINNAWGAPIGPLMDRTEMVQEMRVDIAQAPAESPTMGRVTLVSRSGNNDFHGVAAMYFNHNGKLTARDPFSLTKGQSWATQWILGAGGPVYIPKIYNGKNKTFFFYNLEIANGPVAPWKVQYNVPLNRWRAGDFTTVSQTIKDPYNGNAPFPGNVIPTSRLNPLSVKMQEMFIPKQNTNSLDVFTRGSPTYMKTWPGNTFDRQPASTIRLDHKISDKQFMYGRWTSVRWNFSAPEGRFPELTPKRLYMRNMDNVSLSHTYSITPTLLNEFRYGLASQRSPNVSSWDGTEVVKTLGLVGLAPGIPEGTKGLPTVNFQSSGIMNISTQAQCNPCDEHWSHSVDNNVSWFRGTHSVKFGFSMARMRSLATSQSTALFSQSTFNGSFSGHEYSDFLLGIPRTLQRSFYSDGSDRNRKNYGAFIQDDWKVTSRLTMNLGLRWDAMMPWVEKRNLNAAFDVASGKIVVADGSLGLVSPLMPLGYVGVVEAKDLGLPGRSLMNADLDNFQPRIGLAYRPWGNNTVFRTGFGFAYNQAVDGVTMAGTPFTISEPSFTNPATNFVSWPQMFPTTGSGGPSTVGIPRASNPDIKVGRMMQYSATIEHQRWDTGFMVSYTGTGTRHGRYSLPINTPAVDDQLYINKTRLFPKYPGISISQNGAGNQYHGLTLQATRKTKKGLYFQTYFLWSKNLGDLEDGGSSMHPFDRNLDKGPYGRYSPLRYSLNTVYELPFGKNRAFLSNSNWLVNGFLGGWRLSAIVALESGRPLTVVWQGPDPTGTAYTSGANRPTVTIRADHLRDAKLPNADQYLWFDPTAYGAPAIGRFGTGANGTVVGPPTRVMHNALAKEFHVKERGVVRFEILATNTLNHPNYNDPSLNITDSGAGGIFAVVDRNSRFDSGIPREVQLHLRFEW